MYLEKDNFEIVKGGFDKHVFLMLSLVKMYV
jgi:hypothetical protein